MLGLYGPNQQRAERSGFFPCQNHLFYTFVQQIFIVSTEHRAMNQKRQKFLPSWNLHLVREVTGNDV